MMSRPKTKDQRSKTFGVRVFGATAGAVFSLVFGLGSFVFTQSPSWPQFRNTPNLSGVAAERFDPPLKVLWTYSAGESVESSAAIENGVAYVGSMSGELHAIGLRDGKARWKYRAVSADTGIGESSPAVAGGLVYIGDLAGVVHAVNASTGKAAWTFKTQGEIKSSPVVSGNTLLIGSYDGHLYGLDAKSGKARWKVRTDNYVHATPTVANGIAYFGGCDEVFHGVRISDGREVFSMPAGAYTAASAVITGGVAYFGTFDNDVVAIDLAKRTIKWSYKDDARQFPFYSSAAFANGTIVIGGRDKLVHGIDSATGRGRWTMQTRARVESSPLISGSVAWVGSNDGRLYAINVTTGRKLWEWEAGGPISASPALAQGVLVIGTQDGQVYGLSK